MKSDETTTTPLNYRTKSFNRFLHSFSYSPFYEEKNKLSVDDNIEIQLPEDWGTHISNPWTVIHRPSDLPPLPHQGWKIHMSAIPKEAIDILHAASEICFEFCVSFKYLSSWSNYYRANMKYAPRGSSGKFITVYPEDDTVFLQLLEKFESTLAGFHGPYILSDARYGISPTFFRYGAFHLTKFFNENGENLFGIYTPEGVLTEDKRRPFFSLPEFVTPPSKIEEIVKNRCSPDPEKLKKILHPYEVEKSLHFSNGGGVYKARNSLTGERAVLKEARPWAAYTSEDSSAVDRLQNEYEQLQALQKYPFVPRVYDYLDTGEHIFLVEEYLGGVDLQSWIATLFPFSLDQKEIKTYEHKALKLCRKIERIVDCVHRSGIALMDLQPKNLIIENDDSVRLIDLESANALDSSDTQVPGTPGFVPEAHCTNQMRDLFALCNIAMYLFWPSTVSAFSAATQSSRLRRLRELYSNQTIDYLESLISKVDPIAFQSKFPFDQLNPPKLDSDDLIDRMIHGIKQSSELTDKSASRLYPGDSEQFSLPGGGINIETGAIGIALVLHRAGIDVSQEAEWTKRALQTCPDMPIHGLLRGKLGLAACLCEMGFTEMAKEILQSLNLNPVNPHDLSIRSGLAGSLIAALSCEAEAPGILPDSFLETLIFHFKKELDNYPYRIVSPYSETGNAIGLFDGWSGVALTCSILSRFFQDTAWDELAHEVVCADLNHLKVNKSGAAHINLSGVSYSYLSEGVAGIGYALNQIDEQHFAEEIHQIIASLQMGISLNPGLFRGLAGISAALGSITGYEESTRLKAEHQLRVVVECYSFRHTSSNALFMLGDNTYRLSSDFATGAAGVLAVLLSRITQVDLWLPYSLLLSKGRGRTEI